MARLTIVLALVVITICALAAAPAQEPAPASVPQFEAVSIKINRSGDTQTRFGGAGGTITVVNMQLRGLIQSAYRVRAQQLANVPRWVDTTRVDIVAKADPKYSVQQLQNMLPALLEERLKLKFHREPRETEVLALSVVKAGTLGPNLKRSAADCAAEAAAPRNTVAAAPPGTARCGIIPSGPGHIVMHGVQIDALTAILGIGRQQVVDETGLSGPYDVDLAYTPDALSAAALAQRGGSVPPQFAGVDPNGPSLEQALRDQLGLRLDGKKMMLDAMVIDHIDPPDEN
jgi:uncharacterized protein (TIGR03435 family)